jgi:hypothetical protein
MGSPLIPLALAAAAVLAFSAGRRGGPGSRAPAASLTGGLADVQAWGDWVEATGALPGFATFATAAAKTESGGNNRIGLGEDQGILPENVKLNTGTSGAANEAKAACNLWEGAQTRGYYVNNPYDWRYWCFGSGGWFGLLPATGLAAGGPGGPYAEASPFLVFDPIESVVMIADFAKRVIKSNGFQSLPEGERNWLAVRRGMAASSLIDDYNEDSERSAKVRERFEDALIAVGVSPDFMWTRAEVGDYPGAANLREWLYQHVAVA